MPQVDYWTEFVKSELDIRVYAARRARRSHERIALSGEDIGELEVNALINQVFLRIQEGRAAWTDDGVSFQTFFCRQIHNRIRGMEQKSGRIHIRTAAVEDDPDLPPLESLLAPPGSMAHGLDEATAKRFLIMLDRRNPMLTRVAVLTRDRFTIAEISAILGLSQTKTQALLAEIRDAARTFLPFANQGQ
jgi:DNA-directed RNA polymerase specialized sigma24 family protein